MQRTLEARHHEEASTVIPGVRIRAMVPADRDAVRRMFEGLSDEARFMRFMSPVPRIGAKMMSFLTTPDGRDHVALVAYKGESLLGVSRLVRFPLDREAAEGAVTIAEGARGCGLGRALVAALVPAAQRLGVQRLHFFVHPDNHPARAMLRSLGIKGHFSDGVIAAEVDVDDYLSRANRSSRFLSPEPSTRRTDVGGARRDIGDGSRWRQVSASLS